MSTVQNTPSFHLLKSARGNARSWVPLATTAFIVCILLSLTTSLWENLLHFSKPSAKAATASPMWRIHVPFFTTDVPFNQTAIFWFGDVTSTDNYTDVRMGYNQSELYIDLHIVDRYLWYDPNTTAPDVTKGDNASIYLSTTQTGSSLLTQHAYKFQAAVNGYKKRTNYQQASTGNGTVWTAANIPFTAVYGWRGHGLNGAEGKGWSMTYHLPFSSLGLSGPPPQGTLWKLAIKVHDQDDAANTPIPDKWWPQGASDTNPSVWGDVVFGLLTYQPPQTSNTSTYTIRNKLNGQVVTDGMVGGALGCGSTVTDRWNQLGSKSYPGANHVNIQNEVDISDWNCFSKFYITFPLSSLPTGKGVVSATVTLYQYGHAGPDTAPYNVSNPSLIQAATVNEDWNPATLSWNSAPLVKENISSMLVDIRTGQLVWPGQASSWDVSKALADAYASGQPLRLVFYSSDSAYHTGKYFTSSYVGDWDATGRPTLQVRLQA